MRRMPRMPLRAPREPQPREASGAAGGGGGFGIPAGTAPIGPRSCWNLLVPAVRTPGQEWHLSPPEAGFVPGWFLGASPGLWMLPSVGSWNGRAVPPAPPKSCGFTAFGISCWDWLWHRESPRDRWGKAAPAA